MLKTKLKDRKTDHGEQKGLEMLTLKKLEPKVSMLSRPTKLSKMPSGKTLLNSPKMDKKYLKLSKLLI